MEKNDNKTKVTNELETRKVKLTQINLIEEKECLLLEFTETLNAFMHQIYIPDIYQILNLDQVHIETIPSGEDI